jgi:hypothetical protein
MRAAIPEACYVKYRIDSQFYFVTATGAAGRLPLLLCTAIIFVNRDEKFHWLQLSCKIKVKELVGTGRAGQSFNQGRLWTDC